MFSPEATLQGSVVARNPRRRQRNTSEDSLTVPKVTKRRKRSSLAPDTFEPLEKVLSNGHGKLPNGHQHKAPPPSQMLEQHVKSDASVDTASLAVRSRGSKRGDRERRSASHANENVQTRSENYIVTRDPHIPDALRDIISKEPYHVEFSNTLGYAVALAHSQAIVWHYGHKGSSSSSSKPLVVSLPHSSSKLLKNFTEGPLPLGVLVHDSGVGELALMVVWPSTGKLVYWENVTLAAQVDVIRQKQQGHEGHISSLLSGETITAITEAEPDAFVLSTSAGRTIHVSVRDSHGKPAISSQILRSSGSSNAGLFGSIRGFVSGGRWRGDIAAVRCGPVHGKSYRQCYVVTSTGQLQIWDLRRHAQKTLETEVDLKDILRNAGSKGFGPDLRILDFAIYPGSYSQEQNSCRLMVLTALIEGNTANYNVVDLQLCNGSVDINVVHPVDCYTQPHDREHRWASHKPQILLPEPCHTAFVIFDTGIAMVSIAEVDQSPSSQLQMESQELSPPFQDFLPFLHNSAYHIVGANVEDADKHSKGSVCTIFIASFGLARVISLPATEGQTVTERRAAVVKSRIEQAIFFGNIANNFLEFRQGKRDDSLGLQEVERAALEINKSILESSSSHIPKVAPNMEDQLKLRASALSELIKYVQSYPMRQAVRWRLLWSAEKIASARAIWLTYSGHLAAQRRGEKLLLGELMDMIPENYKHENQPDRGETDIVRHYLINDVDRLDVLIPFCERAVEELYAEGVNDPVAQASLVSQANDIQICALETAFRFREANAELYGLGKDNFEDGIYQGSYEKMSPAWTSQSVTLENSKKLADLSRETALKNDAIPDDEPNSVAIEIVTKLARDTPRLIRLCCQVHEERYRWLADQADARQRAEAIELRSQYVKVRRELLVSLVDLQLGDEGVKLAEDYRDMKALADVLSASTTQYLEQLDDERLSADEAAILQMKIEENQRRIENNFKVYGEKWASACYSKSVELGAQTELIENPGDHQGYLTQFLRSNRNCAKITWMNEVTNEGEYFGAHIYLDKMAEQETNLWSEKIALSMSKLAVMAAQITKQIPESEQDSQKTLRKLNHNLRTINIQEQIYAYCKPTLQTALDHTSAVELLMKDFGSFVASKPALQSALHRAFDKLASHQSLDADELIDLLTLISPNKTVTTDSDLPSKRFSHALWLAKISAGGFTQGMEMLQQKIIWRRCMIQDDWKALNQTEMKGDLETEEAILNTALFQTLREGFRAEGKEPNSEPFSPPSPESLFGAGVTIASLRLSPKYIRASDDVLRVLAADLDLEDQGLERALNKGRLEMWWGACVAKAKEDVAGKRKVNGVVGALVNGNGLEHGEEEDEEGQEEEEENGDGDEGREVDGEGDVVME